MKDIIFWGGFLITVPVGTILAVVSPKIRDLVFAALVFGTTQFISLDINLVSREWYRAMTRGFEVSYLDILAIILLLTMITVRMQEGEPLFCPTSIFLLGGYLAYACLNVAISDPKLFGLFELTKIMRGMLVLTAVAYYIRGERELRVFVWALCVAVGYEAFICLRDRYLSHRHRVSGTFIHPNELADFGCMAVPILTAAAFASRTALARIVLGLGAASGIMCVLLTISRTGCVVAMFVCVGTVFACTGFRANARSMLTALVILIVVGAMLGKSWGSLMDRYNEASAEEYASADFGGRGDYWRLALMMVRENPLGVGLNNWSYWVTNDYAGRLGIKYVPYIGTDEAPDKTPLEGREGAQAAFAHTILGLTLGELGWPGLLLFCAIWARWFTASGRDLFARAVTPTTALGIGIFFMFVGLFLANVTECSFRVTGLYFLTHIAVGVVAAIPRVQTAIAARIAAMPVVL